jgi:hypothetical protein
MAFFRSRERVPGHLVFLHPDAAPSQKHQDADGNLVRRPGEAESSGRERLSLCKPPREPRLHFLLNPSHRVSGDSNTQGEAALRL